MTDPRPTRPRRDPWAFDRWDRWGLASLVGLAVLVTVLGGVVDPIRDWLAGAPAQVEVYAPVTVPALDAAGLEHGLGSFDVMVPVSSGAIRLLAVLPGLLVAVLVAVAGWLVLRLMRTMAAGEPFAVANVWRLRGLAVVLVVGAPTVTFLEMAVRGAVLGTSDLGGLNPGMPVDIPWVSILTGMVVAMLAEAFRTGRRLSEDVEGLV